MFKRREDSRLGPSQISVRRMRISPSSSSEASPACDDPRHSSTAATSVASLGQLSSSRSTARVCSSSARGRARRSRKKLSSCRHCRPFSTLISNSRMSCQSFLTPADSRARPLARAVPPRAAPLRLLVDYPGARSAHLPMHAKPAPHVQSVMANDDRLHDPLVPRIGLFDPRRWWGALHPGDLR
jgi:hypothetical protein